MVWYLVIGTILAWLIVTISIAVVLHRRFGASGSPFAWLPFFFAVPFCLLLGIVVLLIPMMVAAMFALVMYPFHTVMSVTTEGLVISRRIGGPKRVVRWAELLEIREVRTFPFPTVLAVLKTGNELELPPYPESLIRLLAEHEIGHCLEEDDHE